MKAMEKAKGAGKAERKKKRLQQKEDAQFKAMAEA